MASVTMPHTRSRKFLLGAYMAFSFLLSYVALATNAPETFTATRTPWESWGFNGITNSSDIPQFVTITFDDAVTTTAIEYVRPILESVDERGCNVKATFYVSIDGVTDCNLVNGLRKGLNEIATHTLNHIGNPSLAEIVGAKDYLVDQCGVPENEVVGFRAPFLSWSQATLERLSQAGFTYDSSIGPLDFVESDFGKRELWPFTLHDESLPSFQCNGCPISPVNGLWEVPMWFHYIGQSVQPPMDYITGLGDLFRHTLEKRMGPGGNRAPMGIFLHAGYLAQKGSQLKAWIDETLANEPDVYFVTVSEVLNYMRNPVDKETYRQQYKSKQCSNQQTGCFPPGVMGCYHGNFDAETCQCECWSPFCTNANGECLAFAPNCVTPMPVSSDAVLSTSPPTIGPISYPPSMPPTQNPIPSPTLNPTKSPTASPSTSNPTSSPTKSPTNSPTKSPSKTPTQSPISSPTHFPTRNPTTSPTKQPTSSPTPNPTNSSSMGPTRNPTSSPTLNPDTNSPTDSPTTRQPSSSPTFNPTEPPTGSPRFFSQVYVGAESGGVSENDPNEAASDMEVNFESSYSGKYYVDWRAGGRCVKDSSSVKPDQSKRGSWQSVFDTVELCCATITWMSLLECSSE